MRETFMNRRSNMSSFASDTKGRLDSKSPDDFLEPRIETKNEENWPQVDPKSYRTMSFMDKKGAVIEEEEKQLEDDFSFLPPPQNKIYVDHAILEEQTGEDESSHLYNSNSYSSVQRG